MVKFILFIVVVFLLLLATESKADNVQILDDTANDYILKYLLVDNDDVYLYKKIFRHIDNADFEKADELVDDLSNHILLGTVLAAKYLHPQYQSTLDELKQWLEKYSDHAQAETGCCS